MDDMKPKTAKQLEKEAKKAAKLAKFNEKKAKCVLKSDVKKNNTKEKKTDKKIVTYDLLTRKGEKKNIAEELPQQYSPRYVEACWYDWWKKEGFFKPEFNKNLDEPNPNGSFVMIIPPPNVTGSLHLGHALTNSIEDAICRWNRMKGRTTLWVPGCDHAGIATQVVVEKMLKRDENKTRHDLGREEFVKRIWKWKEEKGSRIYEQLESMGSSLDWDRTTFTMDPGPQEAVKESFLQMYDDGTIYRANRLVNWSCTLKSAISDIEVEKKDLAGRTEILVPGYKDKVEFGVLHSFAYQMEGSEEKIIVATTRIETMLGDTAVAVHPLDERYKRFHGKYFIHPFCDRKLPLVLDDFVDRDFGTGAVKITPAHDPNDYEVGKRHDLPFLSIFTSEGSIIDGYEQFSNMKRFDARKAVIDALIGKSLYIEKKDHSMVVPICSRSKDIIEPMLKPQWYVKCSEMAAKAIEAVKSGELELIPKIHEKTWFHWMNEIRDWCISRQLWWGHRIPAYFIEIADSSIKSGLSDDANYWVAARSEEEAKQKAAAKFNVTVDKISVTQDPDVLDTWFSSALFPFSVMGWPNKTKDMEHFYPGTLLETGHDILFFWVARMVFFGQKLTGKLPFRQVYLHAMVRDAHGRKMSKSLGNVIDPMDVIHGTTLENLNRQLEENSNLDKKEIVTAKSGQKRDYPNGIPECGTDALRFALCAYTSQGRDINLDVLRVNGYRNFCNKLWNATKFALMNLKEPFKPYSSLTMLQNKVKASGSTSSSPVILYTSMSLEELDLHLKDHSYIGGHEPCKDDIEVLDCLLMRRESIHQYCHVMRWYCHMGSFTVQERSQFSSANSVSSVSTTKDTNDLSVIDRWMLCQLAYAVKECNAGFQEFNFPRSTTALYNLWWYQICDVYLECLKPVFTKGSEASRELSQNVLFTCLHTGLCLVSPFMPFLSEELYQRLPSRTAQEPPSVCVAPYPNDEDFEVFIDRNVEEKFKLAQKTIGEIRSAKAKYDIPYKTKIELSLQSDNSDVLETLNALSQEISTLSIASSIKVSSDKPEGSVPSPVGADCIAWMKLKGLVDIDKCKERIEQKKSDAKTKLENLIADIAAPFYEKVPQEVRDRNNERKIELEGEIEQTIDALKQLESMES